MIEWSKFTVSIEVLGVNKAFLVVMGTMRSKLRVTPPNS